MCHLAGPALHSGFSAGGTSRAGTLAIRLNLTTFGCKSRVVREGQVVRAGTGAELIADATTRKAYLGL